MDVEFCQMFPPIYWEDMIFVLIWCITLINLWMLNHPCILGTNLTWSWCSVQFSCSVVSNSLWPNELQHTRPSCLSPTPGVHPNSCPLCWWCHPTISSSVVPFSSCPQSFPASGSFQMSQLFASGGQSIGVSASTSVLAKNTQNWSPLWWTGWISLQSKGLSRVFSSTTVQRHLSDPQMTSGKTIALTRYLCWENNVSAF